MGYVDPTGKSWSEASYAGNRYYNPITRTQGYTPYSTYGSNYGGTALDSGQIQNVTSSLDKLYGNQEKWNTQTLGELEKKYVSMGGNLQSNHFAKWVKEQPEYQAMSTEETEVSNLLKGLSVNSTVKDPSGKLTDEQIRQLTGTWNQPSEHDSSFLDMAGNFLLENKLAGLMLPFGLADLAAFAGAPGVTGGTEFLGAALKGAGNALGITSSPAVTAGDTAFLNTAKATADAGGLASVPGTTASMLANGGTATEAIFTPAASSTIEAVPSLTSGDQAFTSAFQATGGAPVSASEASSLGTAVKSATSAPGLIDRIIGGTASTGDYLSAAGSVGGLALTALQGDKQTASEKTLSSIANQQQAQSQQFANYLTSGTLPPGLQAKVDQATKAAEASIKSKYASMGMSGSSAEAQDLANANMNAVAVGADMATQLLNASFNQSGTAVGIYKQLMGQETTNDANLSNAIVNFFSMLAGGK